MAGGLFLHSRNTAKYSKKTRRKGVDIWGGFCRIFSVFRRAGRPEKIRAKYGPKYGRKTGDRTGLRGKGFDGPAVPAVPLHLRIARFVSGGATRPDGGSSARPRPSSPRCRPPGEMGGSSTSTSAWSGRRLSAGCGSGTTGRTRSESSGRRVDPSSGEFDLPGWTVIPEPRRDRVPIRGGRAGTPTAGAGGGIGADGAGEAPRRLGRLVSIFGVWVDPRLPAREPVRHGVEPRCPDDHGASRTSAGRGGRETLRTTGRGGIQTDRAGGHGGLIPPRGAYDVDTR